MSRTHWGGTAMTNRVSLAEPADRDQSARDQFIKRGHQALLPGIGQHGTTPPGQIGPPVAQTGAGKFREGPAAGVQTFGQVGANHRDGSADAGEMAVRPQGDNTATLGTAAALQVEAGREALEIPRHEAVTPDAIMATAGAGCRQFPGISLAQLKNILELDGNWTYHRITTVGGNTPGSTRAESSAKTLRPLCFRDKKRPRGEAQIIRQPLLPCQSILKISPPVRPIYCGSLH